LTNESPGVRFNGVKAHAAVSIALALALTATPGPAQEVDNRANIGMNLWFNTDFNNSFAFGDIVRRARNWGRVDNAADPAGVQVGNLGWPRQQEAVFLHTSLDDNRRGELVQGPAPLPAGDYNIVFQRKSRAIPPNSRND
jgi:hypothetical protein